MPPINRRLALKQSLAFSAAAAFSHAASAAEPAPQNRNSEAEDVEVILFQGDSITDAHRDRNRDAANDPPALGRGYAMLAAAGMLADHPSANLKIYNRGISGNKVPDLDARWQQDCIDLKPDVLSILIGVNDLWHKLGGRYDGTVESYKTGFRDLIQRTQQALPETRIVICEPFVLRTGAVTDDWFPEFDQRREAACQLAEQLDLTLVPFQQMFDAAIQDQKPAYWAGDGVHPSLAGHALMAKTWRDTVGL